MSVRCASPLPWSTLVDYWAGDLPDGAEGAVEEHLFGCEACSVEAASVVRIGRSIRAAVPMAVSSSDLEDFRARGMIVRENAFRPGERQLAVFAPGVDLLVHRLEGLDLRRAERVEITVRVEDGEVLGVEHFAPFDAAEGAVRIACQRHFASFPPNIAFDVRVHESGAGALAAATYLVPHDFQR